MITLVALLLAFLVWRFFFKREQGIQSSVVPHTQPTSSPAATGPGADDWAAAYFKSVVFADRSLEEVMKTYQPIGPGGPSSFSADPAMQDLIAHVQKNGADDPFSLFASSLAASREGKMDQARQYLKQALNKSQGESLIEVLAWKALREMGEQPSGDVAHKVQGVVFELHNEAGVGTLAAYADGRALWLGGQGAVMVWDAPGDAETVNALLTSFLKATEPLVEMTPASDKHKTPEPQMNYVRVSVLTFGGLHIVEAFGPGIEESHPIAPALMLSWKLLDAMVETSTRHQHAGA